MVGPQSVGHELPEKALAASGSVCTATDVAVVLGRLDFGDRDKALKGGDDASLCLWCIPAAPDCGRLPLKQGP
jgi:hypothetical protein